MDAEFLKAVAAPAASAFIVALVGSLVPFVYTEAYLVTAVALVPASYPVWTLALAAALGQMAGKSGLFWSAAAATRCHRWHGEDVRRTTGLRQRLGNMRPWVVPAFTFASGLAGFPPLYLVAIAGGAAGMRFGPFLVAGFTGRSLRLLAVVFGAAALRYSIG